MKTKKRLLSLLLAFCLLAGLMPTMAFAEESTVSVWDGNSVATAYESGDGTEANPYEIATAEQFAYFAEQIKAGAGADAHYILTSDLDMTAVSWEPIGGSLQNDYYAGHYFHGNFDGQGRCIAYSISELSNVGPRSGVGLFGIAEGEILNLTVNGSISDVSKIEASWLGGICGLFAGNITNCASNVDITIQEGNSNASFFGGVTGEVQAGAMQNCLYSGRIDLNFSAAYGDLYAGGLSGTVYAGKIDACKNEGDISVKAANGKYGNAGGIAGMVYTGGDPVVSEIRDCYNEGAVTSPRNAGGIAGVVSAVLSSGQTGTATSGVYSCYSSAAIAGDVAAGAISPSLSKMNYAGEENGRANAIVENCYYTVGTDENGTLSTNLTELFQKLCEISEEGIWVQDANGVPRLYWELVVAPEPATFSVTFQDEDGTILDTMAVEEGDDPISLPELKDDNGNRVFIGWWGIDSSGSSLYYAGEKYAVTEDATFIAYWDEIITLTAPFTTTVELGDSGVPGETVFTLEIMFMGEVDEDMYQDMTISASVTTNGKGDYDGAMTFTGLSQQLKSMLRQGMFVQQVDDGKENWTYDDAVWYLVLADDTEAAAMALSDGVEPEYEPEYKILIFQATCEETENGSIYYIDWDNMDWDSPEENMLFTNAYTAHDYTLEHNETEHWDECGCGDVQNKEAHRYGEWTVTKEATETECGEKEHTCTVCGYTEKVEIEKLPAAKPNPGTSTSTNNTDTNVQSPQTGDNSNMTLWLALMAVSGGTLIVIAARKKRKAA